jgi:hypothetical protein
MVETFWWLPGIIIGAVSLPAYEVLELAIVVSGIEDSFNFKLLLVLDNNWRRRGFFSARDLISNVGLKERNMENIMLLRITPKVEFVGVICDFTQDAEGAQLLIVQFGGRA